MADTSETYIRQQHALAAHRRARLKALARGADPNKVVVKAVVAGMPRNFSEAREYIEGMRAPESAKELLRQSIAELSFIQTGAINRPMALPHMLVAGENPGEIRRFAADVAKVYHMAGVLEFDDPATLGASDLIANFVGEAAFRTQKAVDGARGRVVVIKDLSRLSSSGTTSSINAEVRNELIRAMRNLNDSTLFMFCGKEPETISFLNSDFGLERSLKSSVLLSDMPAAEAPQTAAPEEKIPTAGDKQKNLRRRRFAHKPKL